MPDRPAYSRNMKISGGEREQEPIEERDWRGLSLGQHKIPTELLRRICISV
jgi:hypothetical protein